MPLYSLVCPTCDQGSEHLMGQNDNWTEVKCPTCSTALNRSQNRDYFADRPMIQLDYCYYDHALDMQISSRGQRSEVMKERNLTEFAPDPDLKKHRVEARRIRESSRRGDPDAAAAIGREHKAAENKRRMRVAEANKAKVTEADKADARKRAGFD